MYGGYLPMRGCATGDGTMPETENTTTNGALLQRLLAAEVAFTVTADGQIFVDPDASKDHAKQPAATKPKAKKTTPTKRKESAAQKKFRAEVLDAKYSKRQANKVWKATKPDYMFGVSYDKAKRKGWAKVDGTISKKGEKMTNLTARQVADLY
tara:strand:+ start:2234 stop:2692 length:459 start_codon:yes stop_codon:yes gene_type:complete